MFFTWLPEYVAMLMWNNYINGLVNHRTIYLKKKRKGLPADVRRRKTFSSEDSKLSIKRTLVLIHATYRI